ITFDSMLERIQTLAGRSWNGIAELWTDPAGNEAEVSDCAFIVESARLLYTWEWEGERQTGQFQLLPQHAIWTDSWHQSKPTDCVYVSNTSAFFTIEYSYPGVSSSDWRWRILLSQRPDDTVVLQMTNIAPWGEEMRAVRMLFTTMEAAI
ncbi:MAG: hypothetical protein AAFX40_07245, partial [Cyanobacteria bacterium J06639_1]